MDESKELELLHSNGQLGQSLVSPKRLIDQYFTSHKGFIGGQLGQSLVSPKRLIDHWRTNKQTNNILGC